MRHSRIRNGPLGVLFCTQSLLSKQAFVVFIRAHCVLAHQSNESERWRSPRLSNNRVNSLFLPSSETIKFLEERERNIAQGFNASVYWPRNPCLASSLSFVQDTTQPRPRRSPFPQAFLRLVLDALLQVWVTLPVASPCTLAPLSPNICPDTP